MNTRSATYGCRSRRHRRNAAVTVALTVSALAAFTSPAFATPNGPPRPVPHAARVAAASNAARAGSDAAAAGSNAGGAVLAWGDNAYGELGDGTTTQHITPKPVSLPAGTTVTHVAAGYGFSVALTSDGTVLAWGNNGVGELGNGSTTSSNTPVQVALPAGTTVTQVAAGPYSGYALTSSGAVYGWGDNSYGQLGNGTTAGNGVDTPVAAQLPSGTTVTQISAGSSDALARTSSGAALAWGANFTGQLGTGNGTTGATAPVPVALPSGTSVTQVAAGGADGYAITSTGSVLAWGADNVGQLGTGSTGANAYSPVPVSLPSGTTATQLAAGGGDALARTSSGSVLAWGGGSNGDLGDGSTADQATPVVVNLPSGTKVADISAGSGWGFATTSAGRSYAWGQNSYGQLGDGSTTNRLSPVAVALPNGTFVSSSAAGSGLHSLAVTVPAPTVASLSPSLGVAAGGTSVTITGSSFTHASAVHFGAKSATFTVNSDSSITAKAPAGSGTVDVTVTTPAGTSSTSATDRYTYVSTGSVVGWGYGTYGQLGDGMTNSVNSTPVAGTALHGMSFKTVATGESFSLGLTAAGTVYAWGDNGFGELGNGTTTNSFTPVKVALPSGVTVKAVVADDYDAYALTSTGTVYAWGNNDFGEDGDNTTTQRATPVLVKLPSGTVVTQLAAGDASTLALTSTGKVYAWGYNYYGQLGDGSTIDRHTPVAVHLPSGVTVTQVAEGYYHSVVRTSTGSLYAWGYNSFGQLGDGSTTDRHTPVAVHLPSGTTVTAIAANYEFSTALTSTGTLLAWGYNAYGELGDGTFTSRSLPVVVHLPSGTKIAAFVDWYYGTLVLTSTGTLLDWGYGYYGELGNGNTANSNVPVTVHLPAGTIATGIGAYGDSSLAILSTAPAVTAVSPNHGPNAGGTTVTITGARLTGATKVLFGGSVTTNVQVASATKLTAVSPAHTTGTVDVHVVTGGGTSTTTTGDRFTYTG